MFPKQPPLHLAILHDDLKAVELLRFNEEAKKRKNSQGYTACEFAKLLGKYDFVKLLEPEHKPRLKMQLQSDKEVLEYSVESFERIFKVSYIQSNVFFTFSFLQKVMRDCPWLLCHTVLGYEHRRLGSFFRKKLSDGFIEDVAIKWVSEQKGHGLFAMQDFAKDTYIGEYVGIVRKIKRFAPDVNEYCMHYPSRFFSYNYYIIDAKEAANETRFINHSDAPNLRPVCIIDRALLHTVFFTTRAIHKGEELTFDYGKDYWRKRHSRF